MPIYLSLLRGINVGGNKKIPMADLKLLYEKLGCGAVQTYIQTGNVIFQHPAGEVLTPQIEPAILATFGFSAKVITIDLETWRGLIHNNPFWGESPKPIEHLHATLLWEQPTQTDLQPPLGEGEEFHVGEKVIYLYCPNGYGRTKITNDYWEKKLKITASTRNWNTMTKLLALAESVNP